MAHYLVTGGAGFIGSHLCEALLGAGWRVTGLDSFDSFYEPAVKRRNLATCAGNSHFTMIEGDTRESSAVESAVRGVEMVVHLAARAGVRPSIEQPLLYQDVNVHGTCVILEAMRTFGVRKMIFAGSSSVYGNNPKVPFSESDNVDNPISPYAASKLACEALGHVYHHIYGLDIAMLRFFTVYGPRQRPDLAIYKFATLIEAGKPIPVFGDGSTRRDYTFVEDIVDGIIACT